MGWRVRRQGIRHPERIIPLAFLAGIAAGTILLMLPIARADGAEVMAGAPLLVALFTATSALCVTGLTAVDTATYWSPFGHGVILLLFQAGGIGIMTGATLLGLLVTRRLRLSGQLLASAEMRSLDLGDVRHVARLVIIAMLSAELLLWVWLTLAFQAAGHGWAAAVWHGLFHAVSAMCNAGFSTLPEGLAPHAGNGWILWPLMIGVILGGIGFPVLWELGREWRQPRRWSIHTKLTLIGSVALLLIGWAVIAVAEWRNPVTLGALEPGAALLSSLHHSVMTRSGGFSTLDVFAMGPDSLLVSSGLMLIGGGSASTAGGIRVTTFLLLGFVVWSEVRGQPDSVAFRRRIAPEVQRQATAVVLLAVGVVALAVLLLASFVAAPVEHILFEATSAFATTGLSTGLSQSMPPAGQLLLILLMYVGRVGTLAFATALALKNRSIPYRYPEERPIVG